MLDGIGFVDSINGIRGIATGCSAAFLLVITLQRRLPYRLVSISTLLALAAIFTSAIAISVGNARTNQLGNGQWAVWSAVASTFAIILIQNRSLARRKPLFAVLAVLLFLGIIGQILAAFSPASLSNLRFAVIGNTDQPSDVTQQIVSTSRQTVGKLLDRFCNAGLLGTSLVYLLVLLFGETKQAIAKAPWNLLQAVVALFWIPQTLLAAIVIFWGNLSDAAFAIAIAFAVARMVVGFVLWQAIRQTADCLEFSRVDVSPLGAPENSVEKVGADSNNRRKIQKTVPWGQAVIAGSIALLGQIVIGFLAVERIWGS